MTSSSKYSPKVPDSLIPIPVLKRDNQAWWVFSVASFLVSVPVFLQAPIVRIFPAVSLIMTLGLVFLAWFLQLRWPDRWWGDITIGFSWSWLAGSIYWGWFRWEPLVHLPIEAIGLPFALFCLWLGWGKVGNFFYLGSLLGTVVTDVYFYLNGLIPFWRDIMEAEPDAVSGIFKSALVQMQTPWGFSWAVVFVCFLIGISLFALQKNELHWWAFGGAVLSTLVVDSLFWIAACFV